MQKIEGIILKKINYKESSKIIYLYTIEGLKSVLIHGGNKLKSPYLSLTKPLNLVSLHVSGKNLYVLRDADIINDFRSTSNDLEKYTYATHILEIIYNFATHDHDHEKLYNFIVKIFNIIDTEENYIPYLYMIELKLLYLLGVNPLFNRCVSCEKTENLQFSIEEGGMCCKEHFRGISTLSSVGVLEMMKLYYFDLSNPKNIQIDQVYLKEIRITLDKYYEYHLNFKSNSRKILIGLIGY